MDVALLTQLTTELKDNLRITWSDEDGNLGKIIKRAEAYLFRLTSASFNFLTDEATKEILLERCRYVYNNAADEFEVNFKSDLTRLIIDSAIGRVGLLKPSKLAANVITSTSLSLSWKAVRYIEGMKHYEIFRDGVSIGTSVNPNYEDTGLVASTTYKYRIKAIASDDLGSKQSDELVVTTSEGV